MCTVPDCILTEMQSSVEGSCNASVWACFQRNLSPSLSLPLDHRSNNGAPSLARHELHCYPSDFTQRVTIPASSRGERSIWKIERLNSFGWLWDRISSWILLQRKLREEYTKDLIINWRILKITIACQIHVVRKFPCNFFLHSPLDMSRCFGDIPRDGKSGIFFRRTISNVLETFLGTKRN